MNQVDIFARENPLYRWGLDKKYYLPGLENHSQNIPKDYQSQENCHPDLVIPHSYRVQKDA